MPEGLDRQVDDALARLEALSGKRFGDESDPLLVYDLEDGCAFAGEILGDRLALRVDGAEGQAPLFFETDEGRRQAAQLHDGV